MFEDETRTAPNTLSDFSNVPAIHPVLGGTQTVAIALGSNLGDRFYNIELALRLLEAPKELLSPGDSKECGSDVFATIVDTSFLYETTPMYVTDQPSFINCACLVRPPDPLLTLPHVPAD